MQKKEIFDFFNADHCFTVAQILKQHWKQDKYSYRNNPRPTYGLMLLIHGEIKFFAEDTVLTARAGDVIFLPKHSRYEAVFENGSKDYLVSFDAPDTPPSPCVPTLLFSNAPTACYNGYASLVEAHFSDTYTSLRIKGLFYTLLDCISKSILAHSSGERDMIERAKELLRGDEELTVVQIAKQCGVSESALRQKFKAATGGSPLAYRLGFKLTKAKYLLESTDMSVYEIADVLHFYDTAYFCKSFKKLTGLSPRQFTKSKRL